MLVLSRLPQESLVIGDNVTVTILAVKGNQVRLGIDAPRDVSVHRSEIYDRLKAETHGAAARSFASHGSPNVSR